MLASKLFTCGENVGKPKEISSHPLGLMGLRDEH